MGHGLQNYTIIKISLGFECSKDAFFVAMTIGDMGDQQNIAHGYYRLVCQIGFKQDKRVINCARMPYKLENSKMVSVLICID